MSATAMPHRLKSGAPAHVFTDEDRRKGAARTNAIKAERRKTVRERFAEIAQERAEEIAAVFVQAMADEDDPQLRVKAATAFLAEAFGRPAQAITGADGGPIEVAHSDVSVAKERVVANVDEVAARRQLKTGTDG